MGGLWEVCPMFTVDGRCVRVFISESKSTVSGSHPTPQIHHHSEIRKLFQFFKIGWSMSVQIQGKTKVQLSSQFMAASTIVKRKWQLHVQSTLINPLDLAKYNYEVRADKIFLRCGELELYNNYNYKKVTQAFHQLVRRCWQWWWSMVNHDGQCWSPKPLI